VRAVAAENAEKLQQMELAHAENAASVVDAEVLHQMELKLEESKGTIRSLIYEKDENMTKLGNCFYYKIYIRICAVLSSFFSQRLNAKLIGMFLCNGP
jgi:hypothetical protein